MNAAIYARTSTNLQSTAPQIELCREYISEKGGHIVGIYDDPGVSAHQQNRDGLMLLMKDASKNKFDHVVITSIDRLFRDQSPINEFIYGLDQLGISLVVVKTL